VGIIVALVGGFGATLAFFGSLMALFTSGVGFSTGLDEAGDFGARAFAGLLVSGAGFAGALTARNKLRFGAGLLMASAVLGMFLVFWFYITGAIMLLIAAAMALWPSDDLRDAN
jgi:hypothetical protein